MPRCLLCIEPAVTAALCAGHAAALGPCPDLTATQILAQPVTEPRAWLVDQFGCTHPLAPSLYIGRSPEICALAIMHHSVSARHARLGLRGDVHVLADERSLNGTWAGNARITEARLQHGDRIAFGEVAFYFVLRAQPLRTPPPGVGGTVPTRVSDIAPSVRLHLGAQTAELIQRVGGGELRHGDTALELGGLEFALLRALAERARRAADPALAFLSTDELARTLRFRSDSADQENVRELIRRVRRKLQSVGIDGLIDSRRHAGYRLGWAVSPP
jgi:pSer/pThr/pTyr-binding forkhead associated (FHA) protein